ncbi:polyphosphate kinase 1 [Acidaminobacter hydrogenoformans]|uniref:Polyphosphate kinase n=1 Tax=Acidaminobacter hydrogenoformans DSM 2784 TaxID=1120920 RepID=A0A1G5S7A5_9FIRM|nr:polyphosphate kinase 1 [Acidaminobacter hydrogenoformans]SCZ81997.1 polyphosphate kinase [Acidaminobacter hydrogenoformans DSM 2784]
MQKPSEYMDYTYTQNRDLSWLKFNERVLNEANDPAVPMMERLKFVSIFSSNLDEFFMIRVGSLLDLSMLQKTMIDNKSGMTPGEQLKAIYKAVKPLYALRDKTLQNVELFLGQFEVERIKVADLTGKDKKVIQNYFKTQVMPVLSPQVISPHHPFPHLENKALTIAVMLKSKDATQYGLIPVPRTMPRVVYLPGKQLRYILMEDLILHYAPEVFEMYEILEQTVISVTRNADIQPDDEAFEVDENFRSHMKKIVKLRARLAPVRLELQNKLSIEFSSFLCSRLNLDLSQVYYSKTPLDMGYVFEIENRLTPIGRHHLTYPEFEPQASSEVNFGESIIRQIMKRDLLFHYPYDAMEPVLSLVREAAADPTVISIKITLYRIDRKSKLAEYLIDAVENKKEVIVIMELRARFDEINNIEWAERLEEAGCKVVYGFEKYKIHSKICLITRRDKNKLSYITHVGTGNFNEKTAKLYTDLSLLTADEAIGLDANLFFKRILISNLEGAYERLLVSPYELKAPILSLIRQETEKAQNGNASGILMKLNSLSDREIIDALAEASQAGVPVRLIIRSICCLLPGIPGKTDNIQIRSIVGRYLEHARVFCFGDTEGDVHDMQLYISSADLMTRNTEKRIEIACPVQDVRLKKRLLELLELQLEDTVKARRITSDGSYVPVEYESREIVDCQERLMEKAIHRAVVPAGETRSFKSWIENWIGRLRK